MKNPPNDEFNLAKNNEISEPKISESTKSRKFSRKKCITWILPILLSTFAMGVVLLCYYGMRQLNPKNADSGSKARGSRF